MTNPKPTQNQIRIVEDLLEYTKLPKEIVTNRMNYAVVELAYRWHKHRGSTLSYYKNTDLYIYDLTNYQISLRGEPDMIQWMIDKIKELDGKAILEYGGGIGEFSLVCAEKGLLVNYYDIPSETREYAQWRFDKHDKDGWIIPVSSEQIINLNDWDFVNIMDVLEHLDNFQEIIEMLSKTTKYIFTNPDEIKFNVYFPEHISNYKLHLEKYFNHMDGYLWKNKNKKVFK